MNERGTALIAALTIAMILIPLGTFVALQARSDLLIERNLRSEVEAFYVADAGLEHAAAEIPPGRSFDRILLGPDGIAGTNDDGVFPFAGGPPAAFPYAPMRYDVHVTDAGGGLVQILSQGTGKNGASKVVIALVARSPVPVTPAALYAEGDVTRLTLGTSGFLLSGFDHRLTDSATTPTASQAAVPALATPSVDWETSLRGRMSSDAGDALVGAGGSPSVATVASLGLQTYVSAMMQRPERVVLTAGTANDLPTLGTEAVPQLSVVTGDCDLAGQVSGNGILVVQGALHVTGSMAFAGLVLALGGVVFDAGSNVTISGALWRGVSVDDRLELNGAGAIVYSSAALAAVDAAFSGLLPHAAVVVGWQEQL